MIQTDDAICYNANTMCRSNLRNLREDWLQFWHSDVDKDRNEHGVVLPCLRWFFGRLEKFSYIRFKVFRMQKRSKPSSLRYIVVDWYIVKWFSTEIVFFILLALFHSSTYNVYFWIPLAIICYRLFDIFQSWVSQFVLGGVPQAGWKPIDIYRSLILVFIGYTEIIISCAFFALFLKKQFQGIEYWQQALYYSIRNATTMGSDYHPISIGGYAIFGTEVMFVILFLTAVVNTIISHTKTTKTHD
jgi:hypothetical protein